MSRSPLPGRGPRAARRPRVDYSKLLEVAGEGENDHPNPPAGGAPPPPAHAPGDSEADSQAEDAALQRPAKRQRGAKAAAAAALQVAAAVEAAEEAEDAAALGGAGAARQQQQQAGGRQRQRRQRVLVDVHGGVSTAAGGEDLEQVDNEYERQASFLDGLRPGWGAGRNGRADAGGGHGGGLGRHEACK